MTDLLRVNNLKGYYYQNAGFFRRTEIRAVDGVSFRLAPGETLAVVGESGSGKTTLGRAVLRLMPVAGGSVIFAETDVLSLPERELKRLRRRAQAIFQDPYSSISPYMTVYDIVEEPLLIHRGESGVPAEPAERRELILDTLERVKLSPAEDIATKYPHALSGGQRQRASIARAMVLRPELVVADEPVSMVDASNRAEILSLLRELQETFGIAFLYITHDIANARHFSDRIAVMYAGTIVETGTTSEVIDRPLHPYTKALLAAVPDPDPANRNRLRSVVPGEPPTGGVIPPGCPFHPRCPQFIRGTCNAARPPLIPPKPGAPPDAAPGDRERAAIAREVACVLYQ